MPNTDSARRALRKMERRRANNRVLRSALRTLVKKFRLTTTQVTTAATKPEDAQTELRHAIKRIDQMAARGLIHPNKAARDKSRLTRRLNAAVAAGQNAAKPAE